MERESDEASPAASGFRWPAEWETHRATWLAWPHNPETWPGMLERAEAAFAEIVLALCELEMIEILVGDERTEGRARERLAARGVPDRRVVFRRISTDDSWLRDTGPVFLSRGPELAGIDFQFDAWGGKYPPWERDGAVGRAVAEAAGARVFDAPFVLEGGSIDGDGQGTVLTTESCLLESRPEAGRDRARMEGRLADFLGARSVVWLSGAVAGDDTDGHIDDLARFAAPGIVVAGREANESDANYRALEENLEKLASAEDAAGRRFEVVPLPMPSPVWEGGVRCPASYLNFYIANGAVLVPTFDVPEDERAIGILAELFPTREMIPIPARPLIVGFGAVHCLTQQEPAVT